MNIAVLFQGQGRYRTAELHRTLREQPELKAWFRRGEALLGRHLLREAEGREDLGALPTDLAQPILFTAEYVFWAAWRDRLPEAPEFLAGHSLGEYAALTAAGALDFDTALALVAERGRRMQQAEAEISQGMLALLDCSAETAQSLCGEAAAQTGSPVFCANFNSDTDVVVSGARDALDWIAASGTVRFRPLPVSRAFHTILMRSAAEGLRPSLELAVFHTPEIPVISNVTARPYQAAYTIPGLLYRQITSPVRWAETMAYLTERGIDTFLQVSDSQLFRSMRRASPEDAVWGSLRDLAEGSLQDFAGLYPAQAHKAPYVSEAAGEILSRMIGDPWPDAPDQTALDRASALYASARTRLLKPDLLREDFSAALSAMREVLALKGKTPGFCGRAVGQIAERYGLDCD